MDKIETKAFGPLEIKDEDKGEVEAVVATLGVVDRDGDVILPGAFPDSATVKLSSYAHDIVLHNEAPVGKGTISVKNDKAMFNGRFFMSTDRGLQAFRTVKELGEDSEWSFGYPRHEVQTEDMTEEWAKKGAMRLIKGLTPLEASPVFRGAGIGTGTTAVKEQNGEDDDDATDDEKAATETEDDAEMKAEAGEEAEGGDSTDDEDDEETKRLEQEREAMKALASDEFERFERTRRRLEVTL